MEDDLSLKILENQIKLSRSFIRSLLSLTKNSLHRMWVIIDFVSLFPTPLLAVQAYSPAASLEL